MDYESAELSRERAVSSEPCSTRANPFDTENPSSRKRPRLSREDSRSRSVDTTDQTEAVPLSTRPQDHNTTKAELDIAPSRTPTRTSSDLPLQEPTSSRVTINLRATRTLVSIPPSPPSPTTPSKMVNGGEDTGTRVSVESESDALSTVPAIETPSSSPSALGSPTVELVAISEDDGEFDNGSPAVALFDGDDPMLDFPYLNPDQTLDGAVDVITRFLQYDAVGNDEVFVKMSQWMEKYMEYANDSRMLFDSYVKYQEFWLAFPRIFWGLNNRSPFFGDFLKNYDNGRKALSAMFHQFARLTGRFVGMDIMTLNYHNQNGDLDHEPELGSKKYLELLSFLLRKDETTHHIGKNLDQHYAWCWDDDANTMTELFREEGGSILKLAKLARGKIGLMRQYPKLIDSLVEPTRLVGKFVSDASITLEKTHLRQSAENGERQRISDGYEYFKIMSAGLETIIDKHVTYLTHDAATIHFSNLYDIFFKALCYAREKTGALLAGWQKEHPTLIPKRALPFILAYEWKFLVLTKLITSTQMQLRVVGTSQMCSDLLRLYNQYKRPNTEIENHPILVFLAKFVLDHRLIEYLISIGSHPEIIHESHNILGFLHVTETYPREMTDRIWSTVVNSQDPRVVEAILRMLSTCMHLHSYNDMMYFCQKAYELPVTSFNQPMRDWCANLFGQLIQKFNRERYFDAPPYDLCVQLIKQSSITTAELPCGYPEIQNFATTEFRRLLRSGPGRKTRDDIYLNCIQDISSKGLSAPGAICILNTLLKPHIATDLFALIDQHNLTRLLVEELEHTRGEHGSTVQHSPASIARRELLKDIISCQPGSITPDLGRRLWDQLVGVASKSGTERVLSWNVLNAIVKSSPKNSYILACFAEHLPNLPPQCFTEGALEFSRSAVVLWLENENTPNEDPPFQSPALNQIWRMILNAPPNTIDAKAINILVEVYVDSELIKSFKRASARGVHLALVQRCLNQMASAASLLKSYSYGVSGGDEDGMVIVPSEIQFAEQEQIFARSLAMLREFLKEYQMTPQFATPKPKPMVAATPSAPEGEPLTVKYQSFDGDTQTEIRELILGKLNTAAALIASLQQVTGFESYKVYVGGHEFALEEAELSKSLDDLHLGLVLMKRDDDSTSSSGGGETSLEMEIMKHFEELWGYLSMQEKVAQEIYCFLIKFPVYQRLLSDLDSEITSCTEIFPPGQPFRCLYAIHTLRQYIAGQSQKGNVNEVALTRAISLIVAAISDESVLTQCATEELRDSLALHLVDCLIQLLKERIIPTSVTPHLNETLLSRLLRLLHEARLSPSTEISTKLTCGLFEVLLEASLHSSEFWLSFASHLKTGTLLQELLLDDTRPSVRKQAVKQIVSKCTFSPSLAQVSTSNFIDQFWAIVEVLIPETLKCPHQCEEMFLLAHTLFKRLADTSIDRLKLGELVQSWGALLVTHDCIEIAGCPESIDMIAHGLINLLLCAASFAKASQQSLPCGEVGSRLFQKHLFPTTHLEDDDYGENQAITPKIPLLNPATRHTMLETVFFLIKDNIQQYKKVLEHLSAVVPYATTAEDGPYAYELPYLFDRTRSIRSPTGYVGLRNLSNTCYLNSLFTQLFMNIPFREFMINASVADAGSSQRLLHETQVLFAYMQNSLLRFASPEHLAGSIRTYDESAIDVSIQMDVDEFYNLLFDRWEGQILAPEAKKQFRSFYGGQLVQQVKSKECPHISERLEPFSAIQCDIKGKSCLQESLQAYVDGEIMEGDNKYKCSTCDRHVDAVKRACLKDVPDNLIFHLKRFDFNLRTLQRSKINDHFTFPSRIDMRPYKVEHLMDSPEEISEDLFELVGVLVHAGTAESGHYYSFIRERPSTSSEGRWVEFNDDMVTPWDPTLMENATFGGLDYRGSENMTYDKTYSAYMLFYQRSTTLAKQQAILDNSTMTSPIRLPIPAVLSNQIAQENEMLMRKYCLYDHSHAQFVTKMLLQAKIFNGGQCSDMHAFETKPLHTALNHLDQVVTRTKDLPEFPNFMVMIRNLCHSCIECTRDYLEWYCTHPDALRNLLLRNPDQTVRSDIATSILTSLQKLKSEMPWAYGLTTDDVSSEEEDSDDPRILQLIAEGLSKLWDQFHSNCRAWPEYFGLLASIASLGTSEAVVLLDLGFLFKTLELVSADANLQLSAQLSRMLNIVTKRASTRPVQYDTVIELLWKLMSTCHQNANTIHDNETRLDLIKGGQAVVPFTTSERDFLVQHWTRSNSGIFVEKLLHIWQNPLATQQIIRYLMKWEEGELDDHIYAAIYVGIRKGTNSLAAGPFLRAAMIYCELSETIKPNQLIEHVAKCARDIDNADGREYLRFFKDIIRVVPQSDHVHPEKVYDLVLNLASCWAPPLLTYYDSAVRIETEEFVRDIIVSHAAVEFGPAAEHEEKVTSVTKVGQKLGIGCLQFLKDTYIRHRQQAVRSTLVSIMTVINDCKPFYHDGPNQIPPQQFLEMRSTVLGNLKKLIVEEAEEEVSDWAASDEEYDSEPMGINDLNDPI